MKPEITVQYILMQKGISLLDEIEQLRGLTSDFAITRTKVLQNVYAETMAELAVELVLIRKKAPLTP